MLSVLCQKAGKRNQEDKLLNIFRTTYFCSEGKILIFGQGALKEIGEEGVMELEACEDLL